MQRTSQQTVENQELGRRDTREKRQQYANGLPLRKLLLELRGLGRRGARIDNAYFPFQGTCSDSLGQDWPQPATGRPGGTAQNTKPRSVDAMAEMYVHMLYNMSFSSGAAGARPLAALHSQVASAHEGLRALFQQRS